MSGSPRRSAETVRRSGAGEGPGSARRDHEGPDIEIATVARGRFGAREDLDSAHFID